MKVPDGDNCLLPRLTTFLAIVLVVGLWLLAAPSAIAHPQLMNAVRHRVTMSVGRKNVDITVELTIGEIPSYDERRLMDDDRSGVVTRDEVVSYLRERLGLLQRSVSLSISGRPVELMFLYEPEIDLLGENGVSESQLILRLFYFARTPAWLGADDQIAITDRLWLQAPGMGSYHVTGQDGVEVAAERNASVLWSSPREAKPLMMCARGLAVAGDIKRDSRAAPTRPSRKPSSDQDARGALVACARAAPTRPSRNHSSDQDAPSGLVAFCTVLLIAGAAVVLTHCTRRRRRVGTT